MKKKVKMNEYFETLLKVGDDREVADYSLSAEIVRNVRKECEIISTEMVRSVARKMKCGNAGMLQNLSRREGRQWWNNYEEFAIKSKKSEESKKG